MLRVLADYSFYNGETNKLLSLCGTLNNLEAVHQKLVAEIVLLRLFDLFENFVSLIAYKVACGSTYIDGSVPALLVNADSINNARILFQTHGRTRQRYQLKWSAASEIKENVRYVIDSTDNLVVVIDRNGSLIDEIRRVRNRIAHNNSQSRKNYREVVRRHYGAFMNHITPGLLLLNPRIRPRLIEQYIRQTRIMAKDIVKAQ